MTITRDSIAGVDESLVSVTVAEQAAQTLRGTWLAARIRQAAPQTLVVPS